MKTYVVDSNFFIQAHRATYPLDVATGFWAKVRDLAQSGRIISIDKVKNELYDKNDDLEKWCKKNLPNDFFKDTSSLLPEYGKVSNWAISKSHHYLPQALNEFLDADEADAFLVAYALNDKSNRVLITHEVSQPEKKKKIKIPEPCDEFDVNYMNTIEMFRELGITF
ncbi:MAG: DUF4411 family protein [Roseivirga sp.]|jgi:hypothetical protein|uniref:DUF4411 family protein n=1 Tax=Roseivirga sp. TaxID=1964215 RepID=UPI001B0788DD|nr:DUF4411 family protein [Roseivirga sp.]MBO6496942.1 DUF4411 family protein [Roseivirga sp.]